eukprot:4886955-Amphidinium_carterae.1
MQDNLATLRNLAGNNSLCNPSWRKHGGPTFSAKTCPSGGSRPRRVPKNLAGVSKPVTLAYVMVFFTSCSNLEHE